MVCHPCYHTNDWLDLRVHVTLNFALMNKKSAKDTKRPKDQETKRPKDQSQKTKRPKD
jgi:hypothetical protein